MASPRVSRPERGEQRACLADDPLDHAHRGLVSRKRVRLPGPEIDLLGVTSLTREPADRRGRVVDLGVGDRRARVLAQEAIADAPREPSGEGSGQLGRRVARDRGAMRGGRPGLGAQHERGADLHGACACGERGEQSCTGRDAAGRDQRDLDGAGQQLKQRKQAVRRFVIAVLE
jgi:hypothetical protein